MDLIHPQNNAQSFMDAAFEAAETAQNHGDVPVGAVIVLDGEVIARAGNRVMQDRDPTAHAEILAIQQATRALGNERLHQCDLYVTLEPCAMCAGAISLARLRRVYFAASDPKGGGVHHGARVFDQPTCHHRPDVYDGIGASRAEMMLKAFFKKRRNQD